MRYHRLIEAGLLGSALLGLTAPALAQPDGGPRGREVRERRMDGGGERGGGFGRPQPSVAQQAPRPSNDGPRGGGFDRPQPSVVQQAPRPNSGADNGGFRGGNRGGWEGRPTSEARQPGGYTPRPETRPAPAPVVQPVPGVQQPPRQNWQGGSPGGPSTRGDRPGRNDGRDWNGDRDRPGQNAGDRPDRDRTDRDRPNWNNGNGGNANWNDRDRDRRDWNDRRDRDWNRDNRNWNDNRWRYDSSRRYNERDRWNDFRRWDNNSWRRDQRYNWEYWRRNHRDVYRLPRYTVPYGWNGGYSRFSIGIFINSFWFGSSYWLDDPYRYRLPPAYGSLRWIRYYNDALLVDIRDGYVVDVVYDVFW